MKIIALTLGFCLLTNFSFSQIKKKDLNGIWKTNNDNELLSKTDTIKFYRNIKNCYQTWWTFEKKDFKTNELNICTEPPRISGIVGKEKLKLRKKDFGQIIEYYQNKNLIEKFRIIELIEKSEPELKIMRFDKLTEQKLYKYVDSLVFEVLNYDLNKAEKNVEIKISDSNPNVKIRVRDGANGNPEPLIVVNGYPLENRELLKELLLVETYGITYLTKEQSTSIYGLRAINGVIILQTSEKRFKNVRKKYGR
ncbi:hypothetical protein [Psychroflexus gondwanensis]|jgi:hypothetical protein|uniref:hypothetical protein n=1 Tax=Psychroflexus gondwanensis TaxID=251 RepID=UPI001680F83E|nr:hypothetical protein [Psychroflexus gondwanensis]